MSFAAFYFENDIGERRDLNVLSDVTFTHAEGLGFALNPKRAGIGEGFFQLISRENEPEANIVGDLLFKPEAYPRYRELVDWLSAYKECIFVYCPYGRMEFYRRVSLNFIEKSVRGGWGQLSCAVSLACLTPWYLPTPLELNFESDADTAMRYAFCYDDTLVYGESGGGVYSVEIPARGHVPAALRVRYTGAAADLEISLTGVESGTEYGKCAVSGSIGETETLELFTAKRGAYVKSIAADGTETDLLDAGRVDISTEPFFRAPVHEASILKLTGAGTLAGSVSAQAYFYYRSV